MKATPSFQKTNSLFHNTCCALRIAFFLLMALAMVPLAVNADEVTICDGTNTNSYVPMYTWYCDYGFKSEYIIPQSQLSNLPSGSEITAITLYQGSGAAWVAKNLTIKLTNTTTTSYSSTGLLGSSGTTVYTNSSYSANSASSHTFTFNGGSFTYTGGSLIVQISAASGGTYKSSTWYGVTQSTSQGYYVYSSSSSGSLQSFIPKTTFTYTPNTTPTITLSPSSATVLTGFTQTLTATTYNVTGTPSITYSSTDPSVATVSGSGTTATVTGVAPGTATITAQMTYSGNPYTAQCTVTVEDPSYCKPAFGSNDDCITNFTLGNINNSTASSSTNGYGDYTNLSTTLDQGATVTASLTSGTGSGTHAAAVWIDFNDNYEFESSERVGTQGSIGASATVDITLSIPSNAAAGSHRLRVVYQYSTAATDINPCASAIYGEGEDYTVVITAPCPAPTSVSVPDGTITPNSATANWSGSTGSYNVRYRIPPVLNEDFENGIPSSWTITDADGDGDNWFHQDGTPGQGHNGSLCASSQSYNNSGALHPDNWLITPAVTLPAGAILTFWVCAQDASWPSEKYGVFISTSNTQTTSFTEIYSEVLDANGGTRAQGAWKMKTVDLSAYAGSTVYIAFRHYDCSDLFRINLDDVFIGSSNSDWVYTSPTANTSITLNNLSSLTTYEMQVQSDCGGGATSAWVTKTFTTKRVSCPQPAIVSNATVNTLHGAQISWTIAEDDNEVESWEYSIDGGDWSNNWATSPTFSNSRYTAEIGGLTTGQSYSVCVRANCGNYQSLSSANVTITPTCYPAENLAVVQNSIGSHQAGLSWTGGSNANSGFQIRYGYERLPDSWLQYDNGSLAASNGASSSSEQTWGVMYPAEMVTGNFLTKVSMYETSYNSQPITINIYSGGDLAPGTLLYTETVSPTSNGWHTVELSTPVQITPGQNLWITLTETGTYVLSMCDCNTPNNPNNTYVYGDYNGTSYIWNHIGFFYRNSWGNVADTYGFMIRGYMEKINWQYANNIQDNPHTISGLESGKTYLAQVQANCGGGDYSTWSNIVTFETPESCPRPTLVSAETSGDNMHTATLTWTPATGTENASWQYRLDNGDWTNLPNVTTSGNNRTATISGLHAGTTYTVYVRGNCGNDDFSAESIAKQFTTNTCPPVTNITVSESTRGDEFGWTPGGSNTDWSMWIHVAGTTWGTNDIVAHQAVSGTPNAVFYNVLEPDTDYEIAIATNCGSNDYSVNTIQSFHTLPSCIAPTNLVASDYDNMHTATLTWEATGDNYSGDWEYSFDNTNWSYLAGPDDRTATIQGLNAGTSYTVYVRGNCGNDGPSQGTAVTFETPTCPAPTSLAVTNLRGRTATVTWQSDGTDCVLTLYQGTTVVTGYNQRPCTNPNGQFSINLTGLQPETSYTVHVQTDCGEGDYSTDITKTFMTDVSCPPVTNLSVEPTPLSANVSWNGTDADFISYGNKEILFYDGFENGLNNWTIYTDGTSPQTNGWYTINPENSLSFGSHSDTYCASSWSWNSSAYDADNWLISPQVPLASTLRFWVRTNPGYPDSYEVLLSTTGNAEADFTIELQAMAPAPDVAEWNEVTIDLSAYSGQGYIAIHHVDYDMNYLVIDDFSIESINWSEPVLSTTQPHTITGLDEETTYAVRVQSFCGFDDNDFSEWTYETFTTPSNCLPPFNLDASDITAESATLGWTGYQDNYEIQLFKESTIFSYDFESAEPWVVDNFPPCTTYDGDGGVTFGVADIDFTNEEYTGSFLAFKNGIDNSYSAHSGNAFGFCMDSRTVKPNNDFFILPEITIENGSVFSFYARSFNNDFGLERLKVGVYNGNGGLSSYLEGSSSTYTEVPTTWTQYSYDLSAYAGQTIRLAINCVSNDAWALFIDDISVVKRQVIGTIQASPYSASLNGLDEYTTYEVQVRGITPGKCDNGHTDWSEPFQFTTLEKCPHPTDLTVTNTGVLSASLTWTNHGDADQWTVYYGTGDNLTNTLVVTGNPSATLTCLTPETTYSAYVVANCDNNENSLAHSNTVSFTPSTTPIVTIGEQETSTGYLPSNGYYNYSLSQQIYTAAEIGNAGSITSIDFYNEGYTQTRNLYIYLTVTDKESFEGYSWETVSTSDLVFSGNIEMTSGTWTRITFTTPFSYDGNSNLVLTVDDNTNSYASYYYYECSAFSAPGQALFLYSDYTNYNVTSPPSDSYVSNVKNYVKFGMIIDENDAIAGKIESGSKVLCESEGYTIRSLKDGEAQYYRWMRNGTLIEGATGAAYTITPGSLAPSSTPYVFTREANSGCAGSTWLPSEGSFTIAVNPAAPYDREDEITTPAVYCGFEGVWTAPAEDNIQHRWYTDAACTELYATGSTATMPYLTQNTTLWHMAQATQTQTATANSPWIILNEDFSNGIPSDWTGSFQIYEGYEYIYSPTVTSYIITPAIDLSGLEGEATLSFKYGNPYSYQYGWNHLQVSYSVDGNDWEELFITEEYHNSWANGSVTLPDLASAYYIKFQIVRRNNNISAIYLDDIKVTWYGSRVVADGCPFQPEGHEVEVMPLPVPELPDVVETNCGISQTLTIANYDSRFNYQWSDDANFGNILATNRNAYTVVEPTATNTYYVRSYKMVPGEPMEHIVLQENFSSGSNSLSGWTAENGNVYVGSGHMLFYSYYGDENLMTPSMDMSGAETATLSFRYKNPLNYSYYNDELYVYYSVGGSDWQLLYSIIEKHEYWTQVSLDLPNPGTNYKIMFSFVSEQGSGGDVYLDDIKVSYIKRDMVVSCEQVKAVEVKVLDVPAPVVGSANIVCGETAHLSVENAVEGFAYDWAASAANLDNNDGSHASSFTTPAIWFITDTVHYYVRSRVANWDANNTGCRSEIVPIEITHKPIVPPVVQDQTITCGTPLTLEVTDGSADMANFSYLWSGAGIAPETTGRRLELSGLSNIDERTLYVYAFRYDDNGDIRCKSVNDTVNITLTPINGLSGAVLDYNELETFNLVELNHICQGTELAFSAHNVPVYTGTPTYAVWYRRPAGSTEDSVMYSHEGFPFIAREDYENYIEVADHETGSWQYYIYAATHQISNLGEETINTAGSSILPTLPGNNSFTPAKVISFKVTAALPLDIDTMFLFATPGGNTTQRSVSIHMKRDADADPTVGNWTSIGTYTFNMNGNNDDHIHAIELNERVHVNSGETVSFYVKTESDQNLPGTFYPIENGVLDTLYQGSYKQYLDSRRTVLTSGYWQSDANSSDKAVGYFLGAIHYTYSSGDRLFGCMSTDQVSEWQLTMDIPSTVPDTLMVSAMPGDPELTAIRDGFYACRETSGLKFTTSTTTFGDNAKYVWMKREVGQNEFTVLDSTTEPEYIYQFSSNDTTAEFSVHIASEVCGATASKHAMVYISEVPQVDFVKIDPECAPFVIADKYHVPAVTDSSAWIASCSWQISEDGVNFTDWNPSDAIYTYHNGWYLRYRATTTDGCTEGYSNLVLLVVDSASHFDELAEQPAAICAGSTFDWDNPDNTPTAVVDYNNSNSDVITGINYYENGVLMPFDPNKQFTYVDFERNPEYANYYQFNCYVISGVCRDSIVSNMYTIRVWQVPEIEQLPAVNPNVICAGAVVGNYFNFTGDANHPNFYAHGSLLKHGWEYEEMYGSGDYTVLSNGIDSLDEQVILTYAMNGKHLRYYVLNGCTRYESTPTQLNLTDHPYVGTLAEVEPVCDGTPFVEPTAPEITDDGNIIRYTTGWYLSDGTAITDTVHAGDPMTLAWNGKSLLYGATNGCGTGFSNGVTITVNPLPVVSMAIARGNDVFAGTTVCAGPDDYRLVATADNCTFEWGDNLGTDNVADPGYMEEGDHTFTVTATDNNGCSTVNTTIFTIRVLASDTNVTVCEAELPYVFDGNSYDEAGDYDISYTTNEQCDSVVHLHLKVNSPTYERTVVHLCNNSDAYTWYINGVAYGTYGGPTYADTTISDTFRLQANTWHSDVTNNICDSIIYTLRVYITNDIYLETPLGDDFTAGTGEQINAEANVHSNGCGEEDAKIAIAYQLFKDEEPVELVAQYGTLNISTFMPRQNILIGEDLITGQGEIPGNTFAIQYYDYNYFYASFFNNVKNRITATWNEEGEYRLQMVITRKVTNSGQDFPMTYRAGETTDPIVMGGTGAAPTNLIFTDTVNIYFHVAGEAAVVVPDEPVATYHGILDIDTTSTFNEEVNVATTFDVKVVGENGNAPTKLAIDYVITRNGEVINNLAPYANILFSTTLPGRSTSFGNTLRTGVGSIPDATFAILSYEYDYFYNHFFEAARNTMTTEWRQPGVYEMTLVLTERTAGQDLPMAYDNVNGLLIGGHGSNSSIGVDTQKLVFNIAGETITIDLEESICASDLPFEYNGHLFNESSYDVHLNPGGIYDTILNLTLNINTPVGERTDVIMCDSYEWNGETYTESGIYTYSHSDANGCTQVDTLHLTIVTAPTVRISANSPLCYGSGQTVSAMVSYREGFTNETTVSFTQQEASRDTTEGYVTISYSTYLDNLTESTTLTVSSICSVDTGSCPATVETAEITVIPADSIADYTDVICQGEAYTYSEDGWDESFSISANATMAAVTEGVPVYYYDTIVTGTHAACHNTYRAALKLTVNPVFSGDNAVVYEDDICEGSDYDKYGFTLTAQQIEAQAVATTSVVVFQNEDETANGCDSVTILRLTVNHPTTGDTNATACNSFDWYEHLNITVSGDYEHTFEGANANGCDSIVTLHLTVNYTVTEIVEVSACGGYEWNDTMRTESGDYPMTLTAANGCDSIVTLRLTVNTPVAEASTVTACGSYEWNGTVHTESGTYYNTHEDANGCTQVDTLYLTINSVYNDTLRETKSIEELPYTWNGLTFTGTDTLTAYLETVSGCDSTVTMVLTVTGVTGGDPLMTARMNEAGDTATVIAFANQTPLTDKISINYHLYKGNNLVENMTRECGGTLYIGTELNGRYYGTELSEAEGNVPGNTFHIANNYYDYFYWGFMDGRINIVTHNFTDTGTYKVVFELVEESAGQDFTLAYDDDITHRIGGKNSVAQGVIGQPVEVTFRVAGSTSGDDTPQTVAGPTLSINGPADCTVPDTLYVADNGFETEKVAIRYTLYDGNDEPISMLSSVGSVRVATAFNSTTYGDNLTTGTGYIPEATFHPVSRYYNYFYAGFLNTTYTTVTANWTVPGTYKIMFELVKMNGGSDQSLVYANNKKLGGRNAQPTNTVFDTKTLTYTSGTTAQNPATTGIADNDGNGDGFVLYPNPAHDRAVLTLGQVSEEAFIVITDVNGKEVHRADITGSRVEFNVATWSEGIYFVTLRDKDQIVTKKLVVTK